MLKSANPSSSPDMECSIKILQEKKKMMLLKPDVQQAFPGSTKQYVIYYYLEAAGCYLKSKQRELRQQLVMSSTNKVN